MKKVLFSITALCFLSMSMLNAQFNKGKILLGLSTSNLYNLFSDYSGGTSNLMQLGFTTMKYKSDETDGESEKARTFNLSPRVGYFIVDNLAAGLDINFALMSFGSGDNKESVTVLGIGPFLKYYMPLKKISPFIEAGGSFGSARDKYINYLEEEVVHKQSIMSLFGGIGLAVPIGDMVKFDIMGGYFSTTSKDKEENVNNSRLVLGTLGIKLGFLIYIGANQ